jgi:hypothetical protein
VNVLSIGLIFFKRNERRVKALSPALLIYILVGLTLASFSILGFMGPLTPGTCLFQQWGLWIANTMVFGGMFFKVLRIWRIFDSKITDNKMFVKTSSLLAMSACLVVVDVIVLAIWSVLDPLTPVRVQGSGFFFYECQSADPTNALKFTAILLVYNALILLGVLYLASKSRNVASEFRESAWITQMSANITLCAAVTLLIIYILTSIDTKFYIRMVAIAFGIAITHFCLVGRLLTNLISNNSAAPKPDSVPSSQIGAAAETGPVDVKRLALYLGTVVAKENGSITKVWKKRNIIITNKEMMLYSFGAAYENRDQCDMGVCFDLSLTKIRDDGERIFTVITETKSYTLETDTPAEKAKIFASIEAQQPFTTLKGANTSSGSLPLAPSLSIPSAPGHLRGNSSGLDLGRV